MNIKFEMPGRGKSSILEQLLNSHQGHSINNNWSRTFDDFVQPPLILDGHTCSNCNSVFTSIQLRENDGKCLRCKSEM